jgi:thimet oligopeptidase
VTAPQAVPEAPYSILEPVKIGMTAEGVKQLCEEHLKAAQSKLDRIKALKGTPPDQLTWDATFSKLDEVVLEVHNASEFPYLMGVAHPDKAVRDAAKMCEPRADKLLTSLFLDADLAGVLKAYAAKKESLEGEKARLVSDVIRDFKRNGLELPPDKQQRLRELNEQTTEKGQRFVANIGRATLSLKKEQLAGLPADYLAKHPVKDGKVEISTDYPDYFPFVTYAKDRKAATELYVLFTNRGGQENVKLLDEILAARAEKAKMLGYATWADYAIEPRMAKDARTVKDFLEKVRAALEAPAKAEMAELMKEHVKLGGKPTDKLPPSDRFYLSDRVKQAKYKFNSQELTNYFEINAVKKGLLDITARMYGLEYREKEANAWHTDVSYYEVWSHGEHIGSFYLDLYPREDKFKHAAMFTVRTAKKLADGKWQRPIAALECNFPKTAGDQPGLMSHTDVLTFFHEFGHVLHQLLTTSELASYSGSQTVRDFVEAPSQMFEEWPWSREVLDIFARHHKTGKTIPEDLFQAMLRSRTFGRGLDTQRQIFLATLDQELHTRTPPFDATKVVEETQNRIDSFVYVPGTHFQSSFGHLVDYDAGYYGYQWALSLSRDVLTRFKKEGLMNPKTASDWREMVLSKGGGLDERSLVTKFLGREPNEQAYLGFLQGKEGF